MKSGSNAGGQSGKRRREPAATTVYVVHPTQFRTVVQQLTGTGPASPRPQLSSRQHVGGVGGNGNGNGAGTRTNAAAQARHGGGEQSGGTGRTLGQMHQDLLAWANADYDS